MPFSFVDIILLIILSQGIFLTLAIQLVPNKNKPANTILTYLLIIASIMLFGRTALYRFQFEQLLRIATFVDTTLFLFGPLLPNSRAFKNLVLSVIYDFRQNGFLNALGEISACLTMMDYGCKLSAYEKKVNNGKTIDFEFIKNDGSVILVDVVTINFDSKKYENSKGLKTLICKRLSDKYNSKTDKLLDKEKKDIYIFPILSGFTIDIIKANRLFLNDMDGLCEFKFNSFQGHVFGNLDAEYFDLFTIDEIVELDRKSKMNN